MTADLQARLQQCLGSAYTLERELAGGGMSRVFVAVETALGRRVVVKVLPPDLAAGVSAERFSREVQVAARLQHPHIVPVHSAHVAADVPFYTMPFVEGETLRGRISRGPIPLEEAIRILRDVARALEYAHAHGVVHRDIKPENILLAGNAAVVSDFGIAKAISAARTETQAPGGAGSVTHLTRAGVALGTPAYMSPEQASGAEHLDHRSDIYSLGCVAYEILSGTPPFVEAEAHRLILCHLGRDPAPLQQVAPSVPSALATLVMRCLAKSPDDRPQTTSEVVLALESVATPLEGRLLVIGSPKWKAAIGIAAVVALAAVLGATWVAVRAAGERGAAPPAPARGSSLAVLPFVNIGDDTATEYFADGITDELATALGRISQIRVAARSSAYRYKGRRDLDLREVARDLNVDLVLTGTARRAEQQIRVSAQLSSAVDGVEIWSETFIRPFTDVLALTDSLTSLIRDALSSRLTTSTSSRQPAPVRTQLGTSNPAAYDAYLRGKYSLHRRRTGLEGAADEFATAIALDSTFSRAHAGLANALALLIYYGDSQPLGRPARSRNAALTALRLDSTNTEALVALGVLAMTQHRWREAEEALSRAIELEPGLSDAHFHLGRLLIYQGRIADGVRAFEVARNLEPFSPIYTIWLGFTLPWVGRREQALAEARRAWELDSSSSLVHNLGAEAFLYFGDSAMAQRIARLRPEAAFHRGIMSNILVRTGDTAAARRLMQPLIDRRAQGWLDNFNLSVFYLGLAERDSALTYLERGAERGEPVASFNSLSAPIFDDVRSDPRFARLVTRVGLDPAVLATGIGGRIQ
ncbi:MAG TPA: protein kinase [Gemmatimonadaceae bacterium]